MKLTKKVKMTALVLLLLVLVNGYFLFKNNDVILKKYAINNVQTAVAKEHEKIISKDAIVMSMNEHYVAAPVQAIREVLVTKGQSIDESTELVTFKPEEAAREKSNLETELAAYSSELSELENIVSQLEREAQDATPTTATDSTVMGDNESWNVNLSLALGIEQNTPTAEGIAMMQRSIAETERQIEIIQNQINQLDENGTLISPIAGIVKDIILEGDSITFHLLSDDKKLVAYVTQKEWQEIELDQAVEMKFDEVVSEEKLSGTVIEKQQIPAVESIAYKEMKKHKKIASEETVYEVSMAPFDESTLQKAPIGTLADVFITTKQAANSYAVRDKWLVPYEEQDMEDAKYMYLLGKDGLAHLTQVEVAFTHQAEIENDAAPTEESIEEVANEDEAKQEQKPRIQTVQLKDQEKPKETEKELEEVTVISSNDDMYQVFLDDKERNLNAPIFKFYPFRAFDWDNVDKEWKDVLRVFVQDASGK